MVERFFRDITDTRMRRGVLTSVPELELAINETSPAAIANPVTIQQWSGQIGVSVPSTEAAIADDDGGPIALGEVSEICLRGPQVVKSYWNLPGEPAKVFTPNGWLRTGDMGVMDERGSIRITDRKKDMIVVSGFKVFPNEVEDVLTQHPDVLEAAAIGIKDERAGEAVKAIVVPGSSTLTKNDVIAHCKRHLTAYKVPRIVEFRCEPCPRATSARSCAACCAMQRPRARQRRQLDIIAHGT